MNDFLTDYLQSLQGISVLSHEDEWALAAKVAQGDEQAVDKLVRHNLRFVVFVVRPWHRNIARATLQAPKVYFYDTGLVQGDQGVKFENLVACHLLKNTQWQQDVSGADVNLHYIRTKDDSEIDFCISEGNTLTHLIECKLSDTKPHRALGRFAEQWPNAQSIQLVRECKAESNTGNMQIRDAAQWLAALQV